MTTEPRSPPSPPPAMKAHLPWPADLQSGPLAPVPGELVTKATPSPAPRSTNSETHLTPAPTDPDLKPDRSFLSQPRECDTKENISAWASVLAELG